MGLREKTLEYIDKHGTQKKWLADRIGISKTHMHMFLKGERQLSAKFEQALERILEER